MTPPSRHPLRDDLWPVDRVHVAFYAFVLTVAVLRAGALPRPLVPVAWYGSALLATLVLARLLRGHLGPRAILARAAFVLVVAPITFLLMSFVVPYANPFHGERLLYEADTALFFGANPSLLLDRLAWPPLTEVLQVVYAFYYFIPLVLLACLVREGRWAGLSRTVFDVLFCLYASYVGYFVLPTTGPNLNLLGLYPPHFTQPMEGLRFAEGLRTSLLEAEWIKHDCFPSGHTALSFTCLAIARREGSRTAFRILFLPVYLLIFSTMYLRYHYVVDVIGGFVLAWAVLRTAPLLRAAWGQPEGPLPPAS